MYLKEEECCVMTEKSKKTMREYVTGEIGVGDLFPE